MEELASILQIGFQFKCKILQLASKKALDCLEFHNGRGFTGIKEAEVTIDENRI